MPGPPPRDILDPGTEPQFFTSPALAGGIAQLVNESACNVGDPGLMPGVRKICWRRDRVPTPVFLGFPCGSASKESACNAGDLGSIPGLGRSLSGKGSSILTWRISWIAHGVVKSQRRLFYFYLALFFTTSATWEARISYMYTYIPSWLAQSLSRVPYAIQ